MVVLLVVELGFLAWLFCKWGFKQKNDRVIYIFVVFVAAGTVVVAGHTRWVAGSIPGLGRLISHSRMSVTISIVIGCLVFCFRDNWYIIAARTF